MTSIIYYILIFAGTAIFVIGIVFFLKRPFYRLAKSSVKQLDIILDKSVSEREKDKLILQNLYALFKSLGTNLLFLGIMIVISFLPAFLFAKFKLKNIPDTSSIYVYLSMILGSLIIFAFKGKGNYSYWSKLLHSLVLDNYNLGKYLYNRETKSLNERSIPREPFFVIVSGLARGGTTALTNLLYDEKMFHSITYASVPFLLSPISWKRVYNPQNSKQAVRAHGDNILFNETSIEALEEYFFKVFLNDSYITEDNLVKHELTEHLLARYYNYQEFFRKNDNTVYLSKNNNFILRYESMVKFNKNFKLVLIFRDPLDHAASLLRQHNNFVQKQNDDSFVLQYMNWLGHYEFGLNHKTFLFDGNSDIEEQSLKGSAFQLTYWLEVWINYYSYVANLISKDPSIILVHYSDLLENPHKLLKALESHLDLGVINNLVEEFSSTRYNEEARFSIDRGIQKRANNIYEYLISEKLQVK